MSCATRVLGTALLAATYAVACAPAPPVEQAQDTQLVDLPVLDLAAAEPAARQQLVAARDAVEQLAGGEPGPLAEAYGQLGLLYLTYELRGAAQVAVANARMLAPDDPRWPYLDGYLAAARGEVEQAAASYRRALELEPSSLPAHLRLGRLRLEQGDLEAAEQSFERAIELAPDTAAAWEGLGKVAAARDQPQAAVEHFQRALALEPGATSLHYHLAQAFRKLGDPTRATEELARRGDVAPRIVDPLLNPLADAAASVQFSLVQGAEAVDDGDFAAAAAAFRAAVEADPTNFLGYRGLASSLLALGDRGGAVATLERALAKVAAATPEELRAQRGELHAMLGDVASQAGRDADAAAAYTRSLDERPDDASTLLRAANALARSGRLEDAVATYDRLLELQPTAAATVLEKRATALVNLRRGTEAIADYERAVAAAPTDGALRLRFAEALEFLGHADRARAVRAEGERLAGPEAAAARAEVRAAEAAIARGDLPQAVAALRQALAKAPNDVVARRNLAAVLARQGAFDEAVRELEVLLQAVPDYHPARRDQVIYLLLGERYGEARMAIQEALRRQPRDVALALTQVRLLATSPDAAVRDGRLARELATRVRQDFDQPAVRLALALAEAAAGNPERAAELTRELAALAEREDNPAMARALRRRLDAFTGGQAWVAESPQEILVDLLGG